MFSGITIEKLLLIGVIAALLVGPERLPGYAEALARFARRAREWMTTARTRVKEEMGDDFDDVDWRTLDPRQYDPRRIIREALLDDAPVNPTKPVRVPAATMAAQGAAHAPKPPTKSPFKAGDDAPPPYDAEAT
ncbi:Sec-independent protein translocase TatB [Microbacterium sp. C7(2022)]|uniref:Sec-independent protein translocase TatB n=1 Tax=Microbacterium sp. C7(2022) TaxID=2992759 RepID=UPI00237A1D3C|nr:Sec-independent protein translocase TatB [Microbacterium sp. C7(2022)]MDE0545704.1 Sec-independent protein translocase TatB [Microbacterium sp. C7(2022)]